MICKGQVNFRAGRTNGSKGNSVEALGRLEVEPLCWRERDEVERESAAEIPRRSSRGIQTEGLTNRMIETMEALGRLELPTRGLGNRCSIHLSYRAHTT